jgi:hypothetical protein
LKSLDQTAYAFTAILTDNFLIRERVAVKMTDEICEDLKLALAGELDFFAHHWDAAVI